MPEIACSTNSRITTGPEGGLRYIDPERTVLPVLHAWGSALSPASPAR